MTAFAPTPPFALLTQHPPPYWEMPEDSAADGAAEAAALCRAVLRDACDSTCSAIEAGAVELAQSELPARERHERNAFRQV